MTRKPRKPLDDTEALGFVFGAQPDPESERSQPAVSRNPPKQPKQTQAKASEPPKGNFMSQLLATQTEKEATVRITVDLPKSMHQKLSILSATSGMSKADIIRGLLDEALQQVDL